MCFSVFMLAVIAVACSKDDNTVDELVNKELFIKADKIKVAIGEMVIFSAIDKENKLIEDVNFYINGKKITKEYKFDKKGVHNVVARKEGYKISAPIPILVFDSGGEGNASKLVLSVDKNNVFIGDSVKFTVTAEGEEVTGYKIQHVQGDPINSSIWVSDIAGTFKFIASKEGYSTSEAIEVTVLLKSTVTDQTFTVNGVVYDIDSVELTIDANKNTKEPILYQEGNTSYYVFKLFADNVQGTFAMYIMKVIVPSNTNKIIYPYEVSASNLIVLGGVGIVEGESKAELFGIDIEKAFTKWGAPLTSAINGKGEVEYGFTSANYDLEIKYKGLYKGLGTVKVDNEKGKSNTIERRNGGFSFENLKSEYLR